MTIEEIQEECKRRYVVGTVYKCAALKNNKQIVEENTDNMFKMISDDSIDGGYSKGFFYYEGEWAEIISQPVNNDLILAL